MGGEPRYLAIQDAMRFSAGDGERVVVDPVSGRVHVLSAEEERVLDVCRGERGLDEHAAEAARRLGVAPGAGAGLVQSLAMKGLLLSDEARRALVRGAAREREPAHVATLCVPTKDRSEVVIACARGHVAAARERGRAVTCVIADSSGGAAAATTRAALGAIRGAGVEIRCAGLAPRAGLVPLLAARAGVDPAIVAFALLGDARCGGDTGANRNALLLDGAGEPLVMVDDDVRPRGVPAPGGAAGGGGRGSYSDSIQTALDPWLGRPLALGSGDPHEAWFADPDEPMVTDGAWRAVDALALHEALLGADVAAAAIAAEGAAGAGLSVRASGAFFQRLGRRGGRVVTTQLGCAGDHAMGASFPLLLFGGASRGRLLASEARFVDAFERRRIVRCAASATISDTSFCMSMSIGIDARDLVPPFAPAGRNADGLFGATVRACVGDAFAAFVPWAVEHAPPGIRTASIENELAIAGRGEANDFVRIALATLEDRTASTAARLGDAGRVLESLAGRPREAERFFREQAMRAIARRLAQIERLQDEHARAPSFWSRPLERFAAAIRAALARPDMHLPFELVRAHGEEAAAALFLSYLGRIGGLLSAWPAIFEAARALRAEGVRLSEAIAAG